MTLIHEHGGAFPELAGALRRCGEAVLRRWEELVRRQVPALAGRLSPEELRGPLPDILARVADVVERTGPERAALLERAAPEQGATRFRQRVDMREALAEDRLFRRAVLEHVEAALGRPMTTAENVVLNVAVDVAMRQGVLALYDRQQEQLREAAEAELRYLSFLSHDLGNTLHGIGLWLDALRRRVLACAPEAAAGEMAGTIDEVQQAIAGTIHGMRQLLDHERLRKPAGPAEARPVGLRELASAVGRQFADDAGRKGLGLAVEVPPGAVARAHPELVAIILRNLVGNAVKYSHAGTVRIGAEHRPAGAGRPEGWVLSVSDEGPGIAPERRAHIFEAFRRGGVHWQTGVGLGLAIAARAAEVLGTEIAVETAVGKGSSFSFRLDAWATGPHA